MHFHRSNSCFSCGLALLVVTLVTHAASSGQEDPASRTYADAKAKAAAPLPARVELRSRFNEFGLSARPQGTRNTCSLFAITALVDYEVSATRPGVKSKFSEEFLVWAADEATGNSGDQAMFYEAIFGLNELGICTFASAPYSAASDGSRKPSEQAIQEAGEMAFRWLPVWIKRWSVDQPLLEQQLLEIKAALAAGHPVACGLRWPKEFVGSDLIKVPPADEVYDGHSIVLTGYLDGDDPSKGIFQFRNSAGSRWGRDGYGTISYDYVRAYANDAVWLKFFPDASLRPTIRFEAEDLVVKRLQACHIQPQDMSGYGGPMWSGGGQLFGSALSNRGLSNGGLSNGVLELEFSVDKAGDYKVFVTATTAPDFGTLRFAVDGQQVDSVTDLYSGRVSPTGPIELGQWMFSEGKHSLQINVIGKNPHSTDFRFGIDTIDLVATE